MEGEIKEHEGESAETSKAVFMGEVMDGIEPPAGHFVILIVLVVNFVGVAIGDEIVEPEEQDSEPSSPKRVAFPQMRLKNVLSFESPIAKFIATVCLWSKIRDRKSLLVHEFRYLINKIAN